MTLDQQTTNPLYPRMPAEYAPASTDVAQLITHRAPGRCLEAPFYTSNEIFDLDMSAVFAKQWIFVASDAELPEPGDFVTVEFGTYSIIVVRDDDDQVRALHNVCRHRGARIVDDARGSVGNLVCGYHKWTYGTDGTLLSAVAQRPDFDKACFGLKSAHVRNVAGLIFICLATEPPADFEEVADMIEPYIAPHQLRRTKIAAQVDLIEDGNWKLVIENNRECYHCDGGHPELSCSPFPTYGYAAAESPARLQPAFARYLSADADLQRSCEELVLPYLPIEELDSRQTGFRIQREPLDGAGESFSEYGHSVSDKLLGDFPTARLGRLSMHYQPNAWFHLLSDHAITFAVLPIAPDKTLLRTTWLVHEDAVEGQDYDLEALTSVWRETNIQDQAFVARAQLGVSSPAYEPGPYAPSEYQVDAFCNWYIARLREQVSS